MYRWIGQFGPEALVDLDGRILPPRGYKGFTAVRGHSITAPVRVDIGMGRLQMASRDRILKLLPMVPLDVTDDDIYVAWANRNLGGTNWVVPGEWTDLDEKGEGLWHQAGHFERRDGVCRILFEERR
jgi:hypothetical protein